MENGVHLAWLLDPFQKASYIYRKNRDVEVVTGMITLSGEDVLPGFELDLGVIYGEI